MMKINLPKNLSLISLSSILLCLSLIGLASPALAQEYTIIPMDNCNESYAAFISSNSEQVSVGQRPYITSIKANLAHSAYNLVVKSTCSVNKQLNYPRVFKLAIPDGSDLVQARVSIFVNGVFKGSKIISRGQRFNFSLNPKFMDDYTIIYQAVQGEGFYMLKVGDSNKSPQ
jgi:hypothetical protein